ncbi:MAG: serine--tRNA ligase, partial [Crocinitomicaceae bacterium]|nr:serine--tRNA ligase [Crocinitomicaceae bacterium]
MLEIQRIRTEKEAILAGLQKRNINAQETIDAILNADIEWRSNKTELDIISAELNQLARQIGDLFKSGQQAEANNLKEKTAELKEKEAALKVKVDALENEITKLLYTIPNVPNELVPAGRDANDNETVYEFGETPVYNFNALPHWDLAKKYDLIDFELGVKVTGAGFPFYRGKGAKLQRALIAFFLVEASKAGYEEIQAPLMVNEASGIGTGQLPDKEGQMYYMKEDDFYMIPTAEVPLTNIYRDVILPSPDFSIKMTGYTPCFRREAGSYGKDVRGLNRLHQFDKVEIVRIEHPDNTAKALDEMMEHVKGLLEKLGLQFR